MDQKGANQAAEELTEAARRSYKMAVDRAFVARESNMTLARSFFEDWLDMLEARAAFNRHTLQSLDEVAWEQREALPKLSRESLDAYDDSLYTYYEEVYKKPEEPRDG